MKVKITLGIILPLLIIISLAVLSSTEKGMHVTETIEVDAISEAQLLKATQNAPGPATLIKTITVHNDYFLPRAYPLNHVDIVCLQDYDEDLPLRTIISTVTIRDQKLSEPPLDLGDRGYYPRINKLELSAGEQKVVHLYVRAEWLPKQKQQYDESLSQFIEINYNGTYDELILVSDNKENYYRYIGCENYQEMEDIIITRIPVK